MSFAQATSYIENKFHTKQDCCRLELNGNISVVVQFMSGSSGFLTFDFNKR